MCNWNVVQMRHLVEGQSSPKYCSVLPYCIKMEFSGLAEVVVSYFNVEFKH